MNNDYIWSNDMKEIRLGNLLDDYIGKKVKIGAKTCFFFASTVNENTKDYLNSLNSKYKAIYDRKKYIEDTEDFSLADLKECMDFDKLTLSRADVYRDIKGYLSVGIKFPNSLIMGIMREKEYNPFDSEDIVLGKDYTINMKIDYYPVTRKNNPKIVMSFKTDILNPEKEKDINRLMTTLGRTIRNNGMDKRYMDDLSIRFVKLSGRTEKMFIRIIEENFSDKILDVVPSRDRDFVKKVLEGNLSRKFNETNIYKMKYEWSEFLDRKVLEVYESDALPEEECTIIIVEGNEETNFWTIKEFEQDLYNRTSSSIVVNTRSISHKNLTYNKRG